MAELTRDQAEGLRALRELMDERDIRYAKSIDALDRAIQAELRSLKELYAMRFSNNDLAIATAFSSAEKASAATKEAQDHHNTVANEFRGSLEDQAARMMPRSEVEQAFDAQRQMLDRFREEYRAAHLAIREEIAGLRESRSAMGGAEAREELFTERTHWTVGTVVAVCAVLVALASLAVVLLRT